MTTPTAPTPTPTPELPPRQARALGLLVEAHARRVEALAAAEQTLADEDDAVYNARAAGCRWAPIAAILGVSEVQAHRKAKATGRPMIP